MKTRKKTSTKIDSLDAVIAQGKATAEELKNAEQTKRRRGRPKNKVKKMQCPFYLPENIVQAISENCKGNKSVFAEEVFKMYFDQNGIKY